MSYTVIGPGGDPQTETIVELDSGERVACAVALERDPVTQVLTACARVRHLTEAGRPALDAHGNPVEATHRRSVDVAHLAAVGGAQGLARQALDIVLGEPDAVCAANDHIRQAITASRASTPAMDVAQILRGEIL